MERVRFVKWIIYIIIFILIMVFQFTPNFIPYIFGVRPLLLVPAVVCIAVFEGDGIGAAYGVAAGLLWDFQSSRIFGFDCLFLMLFGLAAGLLIKHLFRSTVVFVLLFTFAATILLETLTWFFFYNLFGDNNAGFAFLKIILPTVIYSLIFSLPIYIIFKKMHGILKTDD